MHFSWFNWVKHVMEEIWKSSFYVNLIVKFNTRETCHDRGLQYIDISSYCDINKATILYIWYLQTETVIPKYQ